MGGGCQKGNGSSTQCVWRELRPVPKRQLVWDGIVRSGKGRRRTTTITKDLLAYGSMRGKKEKKKVREKEGKIIAEGELKSVLPKNRFSGAGKWHKEW